MDQREENWSIQNLTINLNLLLPVNSSYLLEDILSRIKKKTSQKLSLVFILFSLYSFPLIPLLFVMSHLLSFMCCMDCQGRLEAGACAPTAIVQYQYCDG